MGKVFQYFGTGGGRRLYLQNFLRGSSPANPLVWIRDLGDDPHNRVDPWRLPPQGILPLRGDATTERCGGVMGVYTFGSGDGGSGTRGGGYVRPTLTENHIPIHHDSSDIGSVSGGIYVAGSVV